MAVRVRIEGQLRRARSQRQRPVPMRRGGPGLGVWLRRTVLLPATARAAPRHHGRERRRRQADLADGVWLDHRPGSPGLLVVRHRRGHEVRPDRVSLQVRQDLLGALDRGNDALDGGRPKLAADR